MRVIAAIALTLGVLVSTYYYTNFANSVRRAPQEILVAFDHENWSLQIERTFDCVPDSDYETSALFVQLKGVDVFRSDERIAKSTPLLIESVEGVEVGENEIYIEANLAALDDFDFAESQDSGAIRIKLLRGRQLVEDEIFWVEPGESSFSQSVTFDVEGVGHSKKTDGDHDH